MTILPRIIDKLRQADNRGARWLPITDTGTDTETGPVRGRTWAQGRGGGEGEGQIQGAGAAEALLPSGDRPGYFSGSLNIWIILSRL